ncbi:hypothetical protein BRUM_1766 [Bifidobacterium ruminantium]|uniref:Uncharacterized protein n=1 Tax=Bifidobacterium ruminantium TaxID=78346 RepID=A0A087CQ51_BIFRU|nr:hypothetical protein BRUM_1766 [Bifidobacterium ruminantium]
MCPTCPILQNRTFAGSISGSECPILGKRTSKPCGMCLTCLILQNRSRVVFCRCHGCPILQKRTLRVRIWAFVCPILQNRTRGVCVSAVGCAACEVHGTCGTHVGAGMVYAWFMGMNGRNV